MHTPLSNQSKHKEKTLFKFCFFSFKHMKSFQPSHQLPNSQPFWEEETKGSSFSILQIVNSVKTKICQYITQGHAQQ